MKRTLIIAGSILGLLIILMIAIPVLYKGKIESMAKKSANDAVNAKVDFKNVELSLFRDFPQLNISLKNLTVTGIGDFENYQLLSAESFSTSVNLFSIWECSGLSICEINSEKPVSSLKIDKQGKENWDIARADSEKTASKE